MLLDVANLTVGYSGLSGANAVERFSLTLDRGVRCGLVGESGSGKSSIVRSILGLIRPPHQVRADHVLLDGVGDLTKMTPSQLREVRGHQIGYIGQNPFGALHPVVTVERQFEGFLRDHHSWRSGESRQEIAQLLADLGISDPERVLRGHAGELSGGMAQRVAIAFASLLNPSLIIADEPTTALDVTVQRQVLEIIARPKLDRAQALLLVTHDLSVVAQYCDEVVVMRRGEVVERGPVASVLTEPVHPYARTLLDSVPGSRRTASLKAATDALAERQEARRAAAAVAADVGVGSGRASSDAVVVLEGVGKTFHRGRSSVVAVQDFSLSIERGETVALVGESGSGKSTLGRLATMLERPDSGRVILEGEELTGLGSRDLRRVRAKMQIVFQEPYQALNPQLRVEQSVAEPLRNLRPQPGRAEIASRVAEAFELAGLDPRKGDRYPHQLSGGEQQRVGIARAVITRPAFVVLDEPTSSLDLTVRAAIVKQLLQLQRELGMSYLFISHDLATARQISDRVIVMYKGRIVEAGPASRVLLSPRHPYTQRLGDACLDPDPRVKPRPARLIVPTIVTSGDEGGCQFLPRCDRAGDACKETPRLADCGEGRYVACCNPVSAEQGVQVPI